MSRTTLLDVWGNRVGGCLGLPYRVVDVLLTRQLAESGRLNCFIHGRHLRYTDFVSLIHGRHLRYTDLA